MKKYIIILTLLMLSAKAWSQDNAAKVEQATAGVQTGFLGLWVYQESQMADAIALRVEFGMEAGFWGNSRMGYTGYLIRPALIAEPRWYYNLEKRLKKEKVIAYNSADFLSLKINYQPDWFRISNDDQVRTITNISFIPTWGIRRMIGNHFNFEAGAGLGYTYIFANRAGFSANYGGTVLNLHLRIGYCF